MLCRQALPGLCTPVRRTLAFLPYPLRQFFVDRSPVTDGHEANSSSLMIGGVNDPKSANSIFPEPFQFSAEWFAAGWIDRDRADGSFDRLFEVGMERANDLRHMRRDNGLKRLHAVRRFFPGVSGSPNSSSNDRPFFRFL